MAIVFAIRKWRSYLLGHYFIIRTDQKALKNLLEQRIIDEDQQKWVSELMGFKCEVHNKPRKDNRVADSLSRRGEIKELNSISMLQLQNWDEWEKEVQQDPKLASIMQLLATGQQEVEGYRLHTVHLM